jgi:rhomboid protease GluP
MLQKFRNQAIFIVQLIDGDQLTPASIQAKLKQDYDFLVANDASQVLHMIEVFIFNETPSEQTVTAIEAGLAGQNIARRYLSCFTVNMSEQMVIRQSRSSIDTDGLEQFLKTRFHEVDPTLDVLPDVGSLLAKREQEYTIALKVRKPTLTYALVGINIAVWVFIFAYASLFHYDFNYLNLIFGAKVNKLIAAGDYWRLVTPIFLHAGPFPYILPMHLMVNCYSLFILGNIVERIFGHVKYAMIYFIAGIFGNIASFIFIPQSGVGASGAIFGLFGALIYYGVEQPKIFKKYFGSGVVSTIVLNIALTLLIPGIDYTAHLGGLAGGFLTAYAVKVNDEVEKSQERWVRLGLVILIGLVAFYYGLRQIKVGL